MQSGLTGQWEGYDILCECLASALIATSQHAPLHIVGDVAFFVVPAGGLHARAVAVRIESGEVVWRSVPLFFSTRDTDASRSTKFYVLSDGTVVLLEAYERVLELHVLKV